MRINNKINECTECFDLGYLDKDWRISFSVQPSQLDASNKYWVIQLSVEASRLDLILHRLPISDDELCCILDGMNMSKLPKSLLNLLFKDYFTDFINFIGDKICKSVEIQIISYRSIKTLSYPYMIPFEFFDGKGKGNYSGLAGFQESFLSSFDDLLDWWPKKKPLSFNDFCLDARVGLGVSYLSFSDMKSLSLGDVILSKSKKNKTVLFIGDAEVSLIQASGRAWKVDRFIDQSKIYNEALTLVNNLSKNNEKRTQEQLKDKTDDAVKPDSPAASAVVVSEQSFDVEQIQLRLTFDVGNHPIKIAKLRQLKIGDVLELGDLDGGINVRCNDKLIARGEWVEIEESSGVLIKELLIE